MIAARAPVVGKISILTEVEPGNAPGRARQSEVAVALASLACDRPGVVDMFGGSELAVAVSSDCKRSGLLFEGLNSVVWLFGG